MPYRFFDKYSIHLQNNIKETLQKVKKMFIFIFIKNNSALLSILRDHLLLPELIFCATTAVTSNMSKWQDIYFCAVDITLRYGPSNGGSQGQYPACFKGLFSQQQPKLVDGRLTSLETLGRLAHPLWFNPSPPPKKKNFCYFLYFKIFCVLIILLLSPILEGGEYVP